MAEHKRLNTRLAEGHITIRRELVARLRIRGLSQREIVDALAKGAPDRPALLNPQTGEAWTLGTINSDCKALDALWLERSYETIAEHKARVLASLREVERAAWTAKDINGVLRALKQECDLLGLDAPRQYEFLLRQEAERVAAQTGMSVEAVLEGVHDIISGKG